jgi:xylulokinase
MDDPMLLGIDLGTSSVKVMAIDPQGEVRTLAAREYSTQTPQPGWAEQDPSAWVQKTFEALLEVLGRISHPQGIVGIGLSGQMHGTVCLDEEGNALRPAIIWADQRSKTQVDRIKNQLGQDALVRLLGNPLATGFMLPTCLWLQENEPQLWASTAHLLLPKDYLRYTLTGELSSEPSDASGTGLFDLHRRLWNKQVLDRFDIDRRLLPEIQTSSTITGYLKKNTARELGLSEKIPVVIGGSDQACQALGNGLIDPGQASSTIGTGGQIFAPVTYSAVDPQLRYHCFCHVLPDRWHLLGATLSAGLSLRWLRDEFFHDQSYQQMADLAAGAPPGAEGLLFAPYLVGERTPYMDPRARAAFVGLTLRHREEHIVRAVMEGVVFSLRQCLNLLREQGVAVERIIASGGGTKHPLWLRLQADIFEARIHQTRTEEAAAFGAAMLAGIGIGVYADAQDACGRAVKSTTQVVNPDPENTELYQEKYENFCKLYPALVPFSQ